MPPQARRPILRWQKQAALAAGVILITVAIIAGWLAFTPRNARLHLPDTVPASSNRVAVAAFENTTGDDALSSLGLLAADRIIAAVSKVEAAEVLPRTIQTGPTPKRSGGSNETLAAARRTGAALLIEGTYYLRSEELGFQARVLDARTGQALYFSPPVVGVRKEPAEALEALEQAVAGAVAIQLDHAFGGLRITSQPPLLNAYLEYHIGRELMNRDPTRAVAHLQRASGISPGFLLPRLTLAMVHDNQGEHEQTAKQMSQIADGADRLTNAERLLVEYLKESLAHNPIDALRALFEAEKFAPQSWIVNYSIQMEALILNRPNVGIAAFDRLPLHDRYHRYNAWRLEALARALHEVGDYERELKEIKRAQAYQPGSLSYVASETRALAALGRVDAVFRALDDGLSMPSSRGNPGHVVVPRPANCVLMVIVRIQWQWRRAALIGCSHGPERRAPVESFAQHWLACSI